MEELSYSLHLINDKNKSKKASRSAKNIETGTTSLFNNAIQNEFSSYNSKDDDLER